MDTSRIPRKLEDNNKRNPLLWLPSSGHKIDNPIGTIGKVLFFLDDVKAVKGLLFIT